MKRFLIKEIRKTKEGEEFVVESIIHAASKEEVIKIINKSDQAIFMDKKARISELKEK